MDSFLLDTVLSPAVFLQLQPLLSVSPDVTLTNHRSGAALIEAVKARGAATRLVLLGEHPGAPVGPGLTALRAALPSVPVMVIAMGALQAGFVVEALRRGAADYIEYPAHLNRLVGHIRDRLAPIEAARRAAALTERQVAWHRPDSMVGDSPAMHAVFELIDRVVRANSVTVLLQGETGTGKELVARAVHYQSRRAAAPFVEINCTAIPESLLESELFGYEKGAFTDARHTKRGLLEIADRGSLFLDEIGHMSPGLQAKLLRAIEEKRFRRVGGTADIQIDSRIIAGTNVDLLAASRRGEFREDLYYRLNVFNITLPPLRAREGDAVQLAVHFVAQFSREYGVVTHGLTEPALELIRTHPWPGNVRELRHAIERAVLLTEDGWLRPELFVTAMQDAPQLPADRSTGPPVPAPAPAPATDRLTLEFPPAGVTLAVAERRFVDRILELTRGNKSQAARILDISRTRLLRILSGQAPSDGL